MQLQIIEEGTVTVISLAGRMDATTAPDFEDCCRELMGRGITRIVVDLDGIAYMSSAGLRCILSTQKAGKDCILIFCNLQPMVVDIFHISGFNRILSICATREEALVMAREWSCPA